MWPYIILQLVCIFTWDVLESRAPKKGFVCPWLFGGKTWGRVHSGRREKLRRGWVAEMVTAGGPRAASFEEVAKSSELSSWGCGRKHLPFDLIPHWVRLSQHYCTLVARVCVCVCVCVCVEWDPAELSGHRMGKAWGWHLVDTVCTKWVKAIPLLITSAKTGLRGKAEGERGWASGLRQTETSLWPRVYSIASFMSDSMWPHGP